MARVLVGTSGWSYPLWRGPFFPTGLPAKHQLEYYASQFDTVELNGVFYRTPTPESVRRWRDQTGRHFVATGNACQRTRSAACNSSMTDYRFLVTRSVQFCFSCRRISRPTQAGSVLS
jgi:hypothetical protein